MKLDAMSCRSAWMLALLLPQLLPKDPVLMMTSCLVQLSLQLGCLAGTLIYQCSFTFWMSASKCQVVWSAAAHNACIRDASELISLY